MTAGEEDSLISFYVERLSDPYLILTDVSRDDRAFRDHVAYLLNQLVRKLVIDILKLVTDRIADVVPLVYRTRLNREHRLESILNISVDLYLIFVSLKA